MKKRMRCRANIILFQNTAWHCREEQLLVFLYIAVTCRGAYIMGDLSFISLIFWHILFYYIFLCSLKPKFTRTYELSQMNKVKTEFQKSPLILIVKVNLVRPKNEWHWHFLKGYMFDMDAGISETKENSRSEQINAIHPIRYTCMALMILVFSLRTWATKMLIKENF